MVFKTMKWMEEQTKHFLNVLHDNNPPKVTVVFSKRLCYCMGYCRYYNRGDHYKIVFSLRYVELNKDNPELLKGISGHEVAHTVSLYHDAKFKNACKKMGLDPKYSERLIEGDIKSPEKRGKWALICPICGRRIKRVKKPKNEFYHKMCGKDAIMIVWHDDWGETPCNIPEEKD